MDSEESEFNDVFVAIMQDPGVSDENKLKLVRYLQRRRDRMNASQWRRSPDRPTAAERLMALVGKPMPSAPTPEQRAEWERLDREAEAEAARIYGDSGRAVA